MINIDLTFILSIFNYWIRLTFIEISLENEPTPWYIVRLCGISIDYKEDSLGCRDYNLFYFHNSANLFQLDLFFFNLYTKFK